MSALAALAHVELLMFSNDRDLDLVVPRDALFRLAHPPSQQTIAELVRRGYWEDVPPLEAADGEEVEGAALRCLYRPEWQLPAHVVEHRRKLNAARQDRKRRHDAGDHSHCTDRCPERDVTRDETGNKPRDPVSVRSRLGSASPRKDALEVQEVPGPRESEEFDQHRDDDPWFGQEARSRQEDRFSRGYDN